MENINQSLFLAINSYAGKSEILDTIAIFLGEYMPFLFIGIEVYLYFFSKKKVEALLAFYTVLFALLINQIIGLFYFHNRPFMDGLGKTILQHVPENSFPSDHTTFMMAIVFSLLLSKAIPKWSSYLIFIALFGASFRVFVGIHYPFDILGGVIIGGVSAIIIYQISDKFEPLNRWIFNIENKILGKK